MAHHISYTLAFVLGMSLLTTACADPCPDPHTVKEITDTRDAQAAFEAAKYENKTDDISAEYEHHVNNIQIIYDHQIAAAEVQYAIGSITLEEYLEIEEQLDEQRTDDIMRMGNALDEALKEAAKDFEDAIDSINANANAALKALEDACKDKDNPAQAPASAPTPASTSTNLPSSVPVIYENTTIGHCNPSTGVCL